MIMEEIIESLGSLDVHEIRKVTKDYIELVFCNDRLSEFSKIVTAALGPPMKPSGVKPSGDDLNLTKNFGGIRVDQTLFGKEFEDCQVIAMYWPWQGGSLITVKIVRLRKELGSGLELSGHDEGRFTILLTVV
jgi:hypothetical protein